MLKSITYLQFLMDNENKIKSFVYKIIDDDFEEEWEGDVCRRIARDDCDSMFEPSVGSRVDAVINCYESKSLPVAKNLINLFVLFENKYGKIYNSVKQQIEYCLKYNKLYLKYHKEVEKYLSLL